MNKQSFCRWFERSWHSRDVTSTQIFFFDYRTALLKCQTKSHEILRHFTCQCGTERTHMQGFIIHMTDMWRWNLSAVMAPSFLGGTVGTGGCYNDNTVPPGTSKRPTDSSAHISNHNDTGQFKDSQFLYTIVSKNINTLKLTAHLSL